MNGGFNKESDGKGTPPKLSTFMLKTENVPENGQNRK